MELIKWTESDELNQLDEVWSAQLVGQSLTNLIILMKSDQLDKI